MSKPGASFTPKGAKTRDARISSREIDAIQAMLDEADKCNAPTCQDGALFVHSEDSHGFITSRGIRLLIAEVYALRGALGGVRSAEKKAQNALTEQQGEGK